MDDQDRDLLAVRTFLGSPRFRGFLDENLRGFAEDKVHRFIADNDKCPKKSQLHSIPAVVASEGIQGLTDLAKHQSEKNSRKENKIFWAFFKEILDDPTGNADSLEKTIAGYLRECGLPIPDPYSIQDKKERKAARKRCKVLLAPALEKALPVFCEHFTCHYAYITQE